MLDDRNRVNKFINEKKPNRLRMCSGKRTTFACNHIIQTVSERCKMKEDCPGELWLDESIFDTCAECDPSILRSLIKRKYDTRHDVLMNRLRYASDPAEFQTLQKLIRENVHWAREMNFRVTHKRNTTAVKWPTT
jgi:hypothetical protein